MTSKSLKSETRQYQGIDITKEDLNRMLEIQFNTYGLGSELPIARAIISCESNWNINADNGISFGILQFTKPTWKDFGTGNIFNPYWQIQTFAKMYKNGLRDRWDCYRLGLYKKFL